MNANQFGPSIALRMVRRGMVLWMAASIFEVRCFPIGFTSSCVGKLARNCTVSGQQQQRQRQSATGFSVSSRLGLLSGGADATLSRHEQFASSRKRYDPTVVITSTTVPAAPTTTTTTAAAARPTADKSRSSWALSATRNDGNAETSSDPTKLLLLQGAIAGLALVGTAAVFGMLPGPINPTTGLAELYPLPMIVQDAGWALTSGILASLFVKIITTAARRGILEPRDSRKVVHSMSAPLFMCVWPFFSSARGARFFAAIVPLINMARLYLAGTSESEEDLVAAISRSGDRSEVLKGPLIYVTVTFLATLLFWKDSLVGIVAVSTMAAGDGMADIMGRRFGKGNKWFFNTRKSIAGTIAFALSASLCSLGLSWWFVNVGALSLTIPSVPMRIVALSVICAVVEILPFGDDNISVPLSSAILASILLQ